jgi:hypothetical protein
VSAIESWLSIVEPQPRMGFGQISEMTERVQAILRVPFFLCQQCVPEPASQVPLSVVSDISDDINSPEIQGNGALYDNEAANSPFFKDGKWEQS